MSTPICDIINASIDKGIFPSKWKRAKIVPIPKSNPPESLSDLRPISLTPAPGKILEKIIANELSKQIEAKLDNCQYGNTKGSSATHYLIKLTDKAYASAERGNATTAVTIDYSKAFDYIDHTILVKKLINLGVTAKIVHLLISFLTNRSHCTKIGDEISSYKDIFCGVPQGTINGPKLFVIMINGDTDNEIINLKFVDDKTIALTHSGDPTEALQKHLNIIENKAKANSMCINAKKCHVITFNFSSANVSPLSLKLDNNIIQREKSIKLLGVIISDDLKWTKNTLNVCERVSSMLFILCRIKSFGATRDDLIKVWTTILRPRAEYASPLWHSGITKSESDQLEGLQKSALSIILGITYIDYKLFYKLDNKLTSYESALESLKLESLKQRREGLTVAFAKKLFKSKTHRNMLPEEKQGTTSRNRLIIPNNSDEAEKEIIVLKEPKPGTARYYNSAIPYMTRIISNLKMSRPK